MRSQGDREACLVGKVDVKNLTTGSLGLQNDRDIDQLPTRYGTVPVGTIDTFRMARDGLWTMLPTPIVDE